MRCRETLLSCARSVNRNAHIPSNCVAQMFKFDLDLGSLSIHMSDNKHVPAPNNFNPSSEIHISQLMRIFLTATSVLPYQHYITGNVQSAY